MRKLSFAVAGLALTYGLATFLLWQRLLVLVDAPAEAAVPSDRSMPRVIWVLAETDPQGLWQLLGQAGLRRPEPLLDRFVRFGMRRFELKPGEYLLSPETGLLDHLRQVRQGRVVQHTVSIPPGLTAAETAARWKQAGLLEDADHFLEMVTRPEFPHLFGFDLPQLQGLLLPDAYAVPRGRSAAELVELMVERFRSSVPEDVPLPLETWVWLAEQVQLSPVPPREWGLLGAVLRNRWEAGYALEPRPVREGSGAQARYGLERRRRAFRPPRVVVNPSLPALRALARPASSGALFLVVGPDGGRRYCRETACFLEALREPRERFRLAPLPGPDDSDRAEEPQSDDPTSESSG